MKPMLKDGGVPIPRILYHSNGYQGFPPIEQMILHGKPAVLHLSSGKPEKLQSSVFRFLQQEIADHRLTLLKCRREHTDPKGITELQVPFSGDLKDPEDPGDPFGRKRLDFQSLYYITNDEILKRDPDLFTKEQENKIEEVFHEYLQKACNEWDGERPMEGEVEWQVDRDIMCVSGNYVLEEDRDEESYIQEFYKLGLPNPKPTGKTLVETSLEILQKLPKKSLTPETLEILEVTSDLQKRFAKFLVELPEIQELGNPNLEAELLAVAEKPNPLVPIAWNTPENEIHACWNLFMPSLPDFWTEKDPEPIRVYATDDGYHSSVYHLNMRGNLHIPYMQSLAYTRSVILYSLVEAPMIQWCEMTESQDKIAAYISQEILEFAPVFQENIKKICQDVIQSLEITPEMTKTPHLGILEHARLQKRLRAENTLESKRVLEACQGPSAVLSILLDCKKDGVLQDWKDHSWSILDGPRYPYTKGLFTHKRIQQYSPSSIQKLISKDNRGEDSLHLIIFGKKICKEIPKAKRRKLLRAIPEFQDRWGTSYMDYWRSVQPEHFFQGQDAGTWLYERSNYVQGHYNQHYYFQVNLNRDQGITTAEFENICAPALKLPQEYVPGCFGEICEWFFLQDFMSGFHLHADFQGNSHYLTATPDLAKFWMEYLRSHRQGTPRWPTMGHLKADNAEVTIAIAEVYQSARDMAGHKNSSAVKSDVDPIHDYLKHRIENLSPSKMQRIRQRYSQHAPALARIQTYLPLVPEKHAKKFLKKVHKKGSFEAHDLVEFEHDQIDPTKEIHWPKALLKEISLPENQKIRELNSQGDLVRNGEELKHCIASYMRACIGEQNCRVLELYDSKFDLPLATAAVSQEGNTFKLGDCMQALNVPCDKRDRRGFERAVQAMNETWRSKSQELEAQKHGRRKALALYFEKYHQAAEQEDSLPRILRKYGACQKWWILDAIFEDLPEPYLDSAT